MGNTVSLAPEWVAKRSSLQSGKIEKNIKRFERRFRYSIQNLTQQHAAFADLALSFPALLFAIVCPVKNADVDVLKQMVVAGVSLKSIANTAHLPMWTRKLPPEAFSRPLQFLPRQDVASRLIQNHLPKRSRYAKHWLNNVMRACEYGDEAFAVWIARENGNNHLAPRAFQQMALWAWFSLRAQSIDHSLIDKAWSPHIKLSAARKASSQWTERFRLHVTIADAVLQLPWISTREFEGYEFVPLLTAMEMHEESRVMDNCVRTYGMDLARDEQRLWSMRQHGQRIATLSIGNHRDFNILTITELKGPNNESVDREIACIAMRWFQSVDTLSIQVKVKDWDSFLPNAKAWQAFLKPYWLEKKVIPYWLPLAPTASVLGGL